VPSEEESPHPDVFPSFDVLDIAYVYPLLRDRSALQLIVERLELKSIVPRTTIRFDIRHVPLLPRTLSSMGKR
jgi:hypothetical protein